MNERRIVVFRGRVQGVGFRATVRSIARDHDVAGWVRNEPDGSVRLEVEGASHAIDGLVAAVRTSRSSFITDVASAEGVVTGAEPAGVRIER